MQLGSAAWSPAGGHQQCLSGVTSAANAVQLLHYWPGWQQGIGPSASSQMLQEWELLIHHHSWMTSVDWRNSQTWTILSSTKGRTMSSTWGESTPCISSCWGMTLQNVSKSPGGQGGFKPVTCPYHEQQEHLGQHWKEHCQNEGSLLYLMASDSLKGNHTRHNLHFLFSSGSWLELWQGGSTAP